MAKIGFMINTEYHLILTCSIMQRYVALGDSIFIYRVSPVDGKRLNNLNLNDQSVKYIEIIYNYSKPTKEVKRQINSIINERFDRFFLFLENKFWLNFLFKGLKKNNTIISLAPDGMNAYENYCYPFKKRAFNFLRGLYHCFRIGSLSLPYVEKDFAASKYIDEVWVENPSFFRNNNRKKVVRFQVDYNENFLKQLNGVFRYNPSENIIESGSILYIDSSYDNPEYYERIVNILKRLRSCDATKRIYIKLHQLSNTERAMRYYNQLDNVVFLTSHYPAELFIANTSHCTVLSLISTSMLIYNPTDMYFWIYPLFSDMYNYEKLVNPTDYITVVTELNQLEK